MNFKNIVGQKVLVQSLQNAVNRNMIANAYIFNGPPGCGKKTAARIFAAGINCIGKGDKPCNQCIYCKKVKAYASPDVIYIKPRGKSIGIVQIREIIKKVSVKPFESSHRIVIIEEGDSMTIESQNAFLKVLEEPEGNNIFIILAKNYNTMLATIISRCQVFNFLRINTKVMRDYLSNNYDLSIDRIEFAIEKSGGIMGRAIELLKSDEFDVDDRYYILLKEILRGKREAVLSMSEEILGNRDDGIAFLDFLLLYLRDVLSFKATGNSVRKLIDEYAKRIQEDDVFPIIDIINNIHRALDYNVNIKNSIDGILLRILEVCNDKGSRSSI